MIETILQANVYCFLMLLIYFLFLKTRTSYSWSRFYLLFSAVFAIFLPFIPLDFSGIIATNAYSKMLVELPIATVRDEINLDPNVTTLQWLQYVYWLYVGLAIVYYGSQYFLLKSRLKSAQFIRVDGYKMYLNTGIGPGSFGRNIIIPTDAIEQQIVRHEIAHIKQKHYYDKTVLRIISILCPFVLPLYFIKKEVLFIHELQADQHACDNKEQYAMLLLQTQFQTSSFPLIQLFFHHPLKKRIMMLQKSKPIGKTQKVALTASFVLLCSALVLFQGCKQDIVKVPESNSTKNETPITNVLPMFPGGETGLYQYLVDVISYPPGEKTQGTVRVSFIIDKNGVVQNAKVIQPLAPRLDSTALAVVSTMPKWTPAKDANGSNVDMHLMLPIKFTLNSFVP